MEIQLNDCADGFKSCRSSPYSSLQVFVTPLELDSSDAISGEHNFGIQTVVLLFYLLEFGILFFDGGAL